MSQNHKGNVLNSITSEEHATISNIDGKKVFVLDNAGNQITQFSTPTVSILSYSTYINVSLSSGYNFYGFTNPGNAPTTATFLLKRETLLTGEILFANGVAQFTSTWSVASMPSISWS